MEPAAPHLVRFLLKVSARFHFRFAQLAALREGLKSRCSRLALAVVEFDLGTFVLRICAFQYRGCGGSGDDAVTHIGCQCALKGPGSGMRRRFGGEFSVLDV